MRLKSVTDRQWRFSAGSDLGDAGSGKGHNDSNHIDGELELQEFRYAVVDIPAPHNSLNNAAEIIVCQDDVRRLLSHIRPCDALQIIACMLVYEPIVIISANNIHYLIAFNIKHYCKNAITTCN